MTGDGAGGGGGGRVFFPCPFRLPEPPPVLAKLLTKLTTTRERNRQKALLTQARQLKMAFQLAHFVIFP
jgi:hypothetical protein